MKVINIWNAPFGEGNWELSEETGKPDGQLHLPGLDTPGVKTVVLTPGVALAPVARLTPCR